MFSVKIAGQTEGVVSDEVSQWGQAQGWDLLSQFPPFRYFSNIWALSKHTLAIEYHI